MVKKVKESERVPGICKQIKTINKVVDAESRQSDPPCLNQMSSFKKPITHRGKDVAISKPDRKSHGPYDMDIYDFGMDQSLRVDIGNDNEMDIDESEEAYGDMPTTGKKAVASGSGIRKSWRPWFFQLGLITWWTPET